MKMRLMQAQLWRFICLASTVVGLVCYAFSSSFNLLFGEWNQFKIFSYTVFSFFISLAVLFAKVWHRSHSTNLMRKAHLSVVVLTTTSVYSFFYDKAVNTKPDAFSLISCVAFAIMSLSLSKQIHFGFEVDLLYFFLGFLIIQLMKIQLLLAIVGTGFSYLLVILRSSSEFNALVLSDPRQPNPDSVNSNHNGDGTNLVLPEMETILKHLLVACAKAISDTDWIMTQWYMNKLKGMVSVSGRPMQRLGAYMLEAFVARLEASGSSIYEALKQKGQENAEILSQSHLFYEIIPYIKFGYMSANGAIVEAMKDEDRVHIIDFRINEGTQWITLIQVLASRPRGPPHLRITGIDDLMLSDSDALNKVGNKLSKIALDFKVPFEFHAVAVPASDVQPHKLGVRSGEALAINFAFMLHFVPDESVSAENHRDGILRLAKSLSPKVVTLVEAQCDTNTPSFFPRFLEVMDYYTAIFESIDVTLPRDNKLRINVEQHRLARDIINIIACEGVERVERHELLEKWKSRFLMAGFTPYPLNPLVSKTIEKFLKNYNESYRFEERGGALYLGWMDRYLVVSSAWKCDS